MAGRPRVEGVCDVVDVEWIVVGGVVGLVRGVVGGVVRGVVSGGAAAANSMS
jgi:hypothetical protein